MSEPFKTGDEVYRISRLDDLGIGGEGIVTWEGNGNVHVVYQNNVVHSNHYASTYNIIGGGSIHTNLIYIIHKEDATIKMVNDWTFRNL